MTETEPSASPPADDSTQAPHRRPKRRVWTVFVTIVVGAGCGFGVATFVAHRVMDAWQSVDEAGPQNEQGVPYFSDRAFYSTFFAGIGSFQVVIAAVAVAAAVLSPLPWRRRLRLTPSRMPWRAYPALVVGTWALALALWKVIQLFGLDRHGVFEYFMAVLGDLRGLPLLLAALFMGLAPGFCEELLFRGYAQTRLTERWGRVVSIGIVSVLFGAMHMDWVQGPFAFVLGLYLGAISERAGSIRPAVVCHAALNTGSTLSSPLLRHHTPLALSLAMIAGAAVVMWLCVWYVMRQPLAPPQEP